MPYQRNPWSISTHSYFIKSNTFRQHKHVRFGKVFKPKEQLVRFPSFSLLGGNRRDPLNLNELIRKNKQSIINNDHIDMNIHGNDRLVEILLQPNIYDPLCLDISSHNNENSIDSTSVHQSTNLQTTERNFQLASHDQFYDQQAPEIKQYKSINRY
ncbi:unnamed protein product [Rotaria sp. Silwood2]|nr:unnamed protein product [Rotaria sp. Silwood2]CAF3944721.1 unnamed protein product [Rotaria sp. Silwood2]